VAYLSTVILRRQVSHLTLAQTGTNDPNVSPTSFKTLYSYLLVSKAMGKTLDFYTDLSCNLFRLEIIG